MLRPSRTRLAALFLGSLAFVGIGLVVRSPGTLPGAVLGGLCAAIFAVNLLPGAAFLRLDADGFTTCSLFRWHRTPWSDVGPFGATRVGRRILVGYDSIKRAARRPRLVAANVGLTGYGCALPDTYGLSAPELAAVLNEARRRALAASGVPAAAEATSADANTRPFEIGQGTCDRP